MRRIRAKDTGPELAVRRIVRRLGFLGYRVHGRDIPGTPDIVWRNQRRAIFVHGCFWHGHDCKVGLRKPKSHVDYWVPKIERTRARDAAHRESLRSMGWRVLTVWECELRNEAKLESSLLRFLSKR